MGEKRPGQRNSHLLESSHKSESSLVFESRHISESNHSSESSSMSESSNMSVRMKDKLCIVISGITEVSVIMRKGPVVAANMNIKKPHSVNMTGFAIENHVCSPILIRIWIF